MKFHLFTLELKIYLGIDIINFYLIKVINNINSVNTVIVRNKYDIAMGEGIGSRERRNNIFT